MKPKPVRPRTPPKPGGRRLPAGTCSLVVLAIALCAGQATGHAQSISPPKVQGGLSVQDTVRAALANSPTVRAMLADARAAQAEKSVARAMTQPQLSANTTLAAGSMGAIFPSTPGVSPPNYVATPGKPFADQNLTLMVPLYTGGRLSGQVAAAAERARAAQAGVGASQADTVLAVKTAYYRTLLASSMVEVARARIEAANAMARNAQALFEAGKGIQAAVSRAQAEAADAQRVLTTATNDQAKAMLDLKAAMGVSLDSDVTLTDSLTAAPPAGELGGFLTEAQQKRPEINAARARLEAARAQTGVARSGFAPQVYGAAMADGFSSREMGTSAGYAVGITASLPLYDAGQRRAELSQSRAMEERARADLAGIELTVANEVRQAVLDLQAAEQNHRTAMAAEAAARQAYDVAVVRVEAGKAISLEQLDALAALTQARAGLAQSLFDHASAVARLQRAVGRNQ